MVTPARKIGDNLFAIQSFNGDQEYIVNLSGSKATCSCPHYQMRLAGTDRGPCKHIVAVATQATYIEYLEKARGCTDEQIANLLPKYADDPMVNGALRVVRAERRADQQLRDVFA